MDIEKINVSTLIRECGISRSLFYYYYQDMFGVNEDLLSSEMGKIMEECASIEDPYESVKHYVYCFSGQFPILRRVQGTRYYETAERMIIDANNRYLGDVFRKKVGDKEISMDYALFVLDYMSAGMTAYFFKHCSEDCFDKEKASRFLYRMIARVIELPEI